MIPRMLAFVLMATIIGSASPASAKPSSKSKEKKTPEKVAARTWKAVAEFVLKNGVEHPIKAPASRTLGYDSDEVAAKLLRIKTAASKDKKEHSVSVTYASEEKGNLRPKEVVLGVIFVEVVPSGQQIDSFRLRLDLNGKLISVMHSTGIVGQVLQKSLATDSPEANAVYKAESTLHLETHPLDKLTR